MSEPLLRTKGLSRTFGAFTAVDGVSLSIPYGARHALIGPNGAGKTTLVNLLSGALAPTSGEIEFSGVQITRQRMDRRVKQGIARTYQITNLFPRLSALDQVALAILERDGLGWTWLRSRAVCATQIEEAKALLDIVRLGSDRDCPVRSLPYGKQRLLEIALGLAARPKLLLLDEPAAGIPSTQSAEVFAVIAALPRDTAVLFIEHDMDLVYRFAEHITVLVNGGIFAQGSPAEISRNIQVRRVYLGEDAHA